MSLIKRHLAKIIAVLLWLAVLIAIYYTLDSRNLTLPQLLDDARNHLNTAWYGSLVFLFVIGILRPFTLVPTVILIVAGGMIFGLSEGFIYGLIGTTVSAILPYYAGMLFAVEIKPDDDLGIFRKPAQKIAQFLLDNAFESLVALRLIQGPYDIVSFVAGNINMPLRVFMIGTFVGNIPAVYVFVALGASLDVELTTGQYAVDGRLIASSVAVFIASVVAAQYLRIRKRRIDTEHSDNAPSRNDAQQPDAA